MSSIRTHRGQMIDMAQLVAQNEETIAVGNMRSNARGDILGKGGKIVKTKEEVVSEYYKANPQGVKQVSIKDKLSDDFFETPKQIMDRVTKQPNESTTKKRKIIDTEE